MTTPLDLGLLQNFGVIFPMLFVFLIAYAILMKTDLFKGNKGLASLLGIVLAVMVLFSPIVRETINVMAPWFILFFIFIVFALIAFMIFGSTEKDIMGVFRSEKYSYVGIWIIAIVLIIAVGSLASVISQHGGFGTTGGTVENASTTSSSQQASQFWTTLVDPKVLGMALVLMIASFTVRYMTKMK